MIKFKNIALKRQRKQLNIQTTKSQKMQMKK